MRNRFGADIPLQTAASTKSVKKHFENLVKKVWSIALGGENSGKRALFRAHSVAQLALQR